MSDPRALARTLDSLSEIIHDDGAALLERAVADDAAFEDLTKATDLVAYELIGFQSKIREACWRAINGTPRPVPVKPVQPKPPPPPPPRDSSDVAAVAEAQAIVARVIASRPGRPHLSIVREVDQ